MRKTLLGAASIALLAEAAMAQEKIVISSGWAELTADLADNAATRALLDMLPLTLDMRDHLRQEKTGRLPSALPAAVRQQDFGNGTLGLWGGTDFVIYYKEGRVPQPGIIILGQIQGDASAFDRDGPVVVTIRRAD